MTIIHLAQPLPAGSSDLPGGRSRFEISNLKFQNDFGRAALLTPPYLVLHREEFAWPRMSPHAPVRSYIKPLPGRTVSPITPRFGFQILESESTVGWSLLCCTCRHSKGSPLKLQI